MIHPTIWPQYTNVTGIERFANILRSRYVARTPLSEARSPGHRSNAENASVTCCSLISKARAPRIN